MHGDTEHGVAQFQPLGSESKKLKMKLTLIKTKWIIIGFNIGIGLALLYLLIFLIFSLTLLLTKELFGEASFAAIVMGAVIIIVGIGLLMLLPAFAGKTIALLINRFRSRKPPMSPED